jgi:2-polyprenyl-3-methyl-5-hydroxy-6-metoxy-1,4-benzoquinol methylase
MEYFYGKKISEDFVKTKLNWNSKKYIEDAKKIAKISDIQQKKCFICGSDRSKTVSSFYGIKYKMCLNCSHVYANKRLSEEKLTEFYSENKIYSTNTYANKQLIKIREKVFKSKIQFVKKFTKKKNWLDIGSADGASVIAAIKEGFSCEGIEISEPSRKFAKKYHNIDLYPDSLFLFEKINKKKWNVISFFGVLEHLPDRFSALKTSYRLLDDNGIVVIEVPNYQSVSSYVQELSGLADRHLVPYTHIMMFTENSMKYALKKTGFESIAFWYYGMDMIELLKHLSKEKNFKNSKLDNFLQKNLNKIQLIIDENKKSDFLYVIGAKMKK